MSACIGPMGEYSTHTASPADPYTCEWCGEEDTERMREAIASLIAAAPLVWAQAVEACAVELETARQAGGAYGQSMRRLNNGKNLAAHLRRWAEERKAS